MAFPQQATQVIKIIFYYAIFWILIKDDNFNLKIIEEVCMF
jgi:hypothetical protein